MTRKGIVVELEDVLEHIRQGLKGSMGKNGENFFDARDKLAEVIEQTRHDMHMIREMIHCVENYPREKGDYVDKQTPIVLQRLWAMLGRVEQNQ
jgi:excinuclease UvrABC helicase subunit UvrB